MDWSHLKDFLPFVQEIQWAAFRSANRWRTFCPVPNDEHQQEQGSRVKHSGVTCTSECSPVVRRKYYNTERNTKLYADEDIFYYTVFNLIFLLTLLLLNTTPPVLTNSVDPDQLASALFVIKYVNFYQKPRLAGI